MPETLRDRLLEQLAPVAPLVKELVDRAYTDGSEQATAAKMPHIRRPAHVRRMAGLSRWISVADGLVDAGEADQLPNAFSVASGDAEHNAGRYAFSFPLGVFSLRRSPHDDDQDEGQFLQERFTHVVEVLDLQGLPDADAAMRVWIRVADNNRSTFTARDRHGHEVTVTLSDLLAHQAAPVVTLPTDVARTQVRSTRPAADDQPAE